MSTLTRLPRPTLYAKCLRLAIPCLFSGLPIGLLVLSLQVVNAAPGVGNTIWLDGVGNTFMPVDVAVNAQTGYAYVVNQGAGNVWVISGTEYVAELGGGAQCPGPTGYGACSVP